MEKLIQCVLLFVIVNRVQAANVLFAIPFSGRSHYIMLQPIALELVNRGHNVTVMTAFLEKHPPPNYHQVYSDTKSIWDILGTKPNIFNIKDYSFAKYHNEVQWPGSLYVTETIFNSSAVAHFLKQDNEFDLVVCSVFYQESLMMLAHKYNAPLVLITTFGHSIKLNHLLRNPITFMTNFHEVGQFTTPTSFYNTLTNLFYFFYELFWYYSWYLPEHEVLVKKHLPNLPKPVPSLIEVQQSASLVLLNTHFSINSPRSYYPNVVEVGGIHLHHAMKTNITLPEDIRSFLDNAENGVIYMSFGSNIKSKDLPMHKKLAFVSAFARLNHPVLWKWEDDEISILPNNVKVKAWMPQREVLSHPNVKVFISHGGLIGVQEASTFGVPILGIPIFYDQYNNILQIVEHKYGLMVDYNDISEETISEALKTLLTDKKYEKNAKDVARRFKDRPLSPMDTAMFWIEYVIRHKGADFIKNRGLKMSWIQWNMIDVYIFLLSVLAVIGFAFYKISTRLSSPDGAKEKFKKL